MNMHSPDDAIRKDLAIVFYTGSGNTGRIAEEVARGVEEVESSSATLIALSAGDIVGGRYRNAQVMKAIDRADALIMGSPTYMGGPAAQFKAFADASSERWPTKIWDNKWAAGFTVGASASGEQSATLQYFSILAQQQGMVWLGMDVRGPNPLGCALGLALQSSDEMAEQNIAAARAFGRRIARFALGATLLTST